MKKEAREKLLKEYGSGKYDRYAGVMKEAVRDALLSFIEQDEEFAQAVMQGGTFKDCMKAVAKSVGQAISDRDAYERAVRFYFPGAKIKFQMSIDLIGDAAESTQPEPTPPEPKAGIILELSSFF